MNNLDNVISTSDININIPSPDNNLYVCKNIKLILSDIQNIIDNEKIIFNNNIVSDLYNILYSVNLIKTNIIKHL
jgi:hypothetical protein